MHFQPGFMFGVVIGIAFATELGKQEDGRVAAWSALAMLTTGIAAWLCWATLQSHASGDRPRALVIVAETALAGLAITGIESTVITMMPIRFMAGEKIAAWSRPVWAALFAASLFVFVEVLLRPGTGYVSHASRASAAGVLALLLSLAALSIGFWAYFRFRRRRHTTHKGSPGGDPASPSETIRA
jgi:hypothetical protein